MSKQTENLKLHLYESSDTFAITAEDNSLNNNMELIDAAISSKADKEYLNNEISTLNSKMNTLSSTGLKREILSELPELSDSDINTIYMIGPKYDNNNSVYYDEYLVIKTVSESNDVKLLNTIINASNDITFDGQFKLIMFEPDYQSSDANAYLYTFENGSYTFSISSTTEVSFITWWETNACDGWMVAFDANTAISNNEVNVNFYKSIEQFELIGTSTPDLSTKMDVFGTVDKVLNGSVENGVEQYNYTINTPNDVDCLIINSNNICLNGKGVLSFEKTASGYVWFNGNGIYDTPQISGLETPINNNDAANKAYVDAAIAAALNK